MQAPSHPRQEARLAALRGYGILDTPREEDFDEIVRLASEICGAPISVVNLIDAERQWFKAEVGLGVRETPLETSLCSHAILEEDFVEIPDTLADRRMRDNPLCLGDPGLRFYAGALLRTEEGLPLGTLCVLDYRPRQLTDFQRRALAVLAKQVMKQLDLGLALKRQALLLKEIDHRVKNSMHSVGAMVRLERQKAGGEAARAVLLDVEARIANMALLHEELYRAGGAETVDISHYLKKIGGMLQGLAPANVVVSVDAVSHTIEGRRASALGIIVSEFVTNAIKHAFPGGRTGKVKIDMRPMEDGGSWRLDCQDDGVGSAAAKAEPPGIGLFLVQAAAAQAGAHLETQSSPSGVRLTATLPEP